MKTIYNYIRSDAIHFLLALRLYSSLCRERLVFANQWSTFGMKEHINELWIKNAGVLNERAQMSSRNGLWSSHTIYISTYNIRGTSVRKVINNLYSWVRKDLFIHYPNASNIIRCYVRFATIHCWRKIITSERLLACMIFNTNTW